MSRHQYGISALVSILRRRFAGIPVVVSQNVGCFLWLICKTLLRCRAETISEMKIVWKAELMSITSRESWIEKCYSSFSSLTTEINWWKIWVLLSACAISNDIPMTWVKNQICLFPRIINTFKFGFEVDRLLFHFFILYFTFVILPVSGPERTVHVPKKKWVRDVQGIHFSLTSLQFK